MMASFSVSHAMDGSPPTTCESKIKKDVPVIVVVTANFSHQEKVFDSDIGSYDLSNYNTSFNLEEKKIQRSFVNNKVSRRYHQRCRYIKYRIKHDKYLGSNHIKKE